MPIKLKKDGNAFLNERIANPVFFNLFVTGRELPERKARNTAQDNARVTGKS
jgi:hypothetical protein